MRYAKETLWRLYYDMLRIRQFRLRIDSLCLDNNMKTPVHLCIGQEPFPVGGVLRARGWRVAGLAVPWRLSNGTAWEDGGGPKCACFFPAVIRKIAGGNGQGNRRRPQASLKIHASVGKVSFGQEDQSPLRHHPDPS